MDKLQLLEQVLGKGHKANRDYYQFECPFHHGKNGPKLGISLGTGKWKCWVCASKGMSVVNLFKRLNANQQQQQHAKTLFGERIQFDVNTLVQSVSLPKEYIPLYNSSGSIFHRNAKNYLQGRGVNELDIMKYRIGYCEFGKFSDMIVFPTYDFQGSLSTFTTRSFTNLHSRKFLLAGNFDKNNIVPDEHLINWNEPVIIVESKLDAIVIKRNAFSLDGKELLQKVKRKIIESETPEIILCLDGDALIAMMNHASYFINQGVKVKLVELPYNEDANSLGYEKVWQYINNAKVVTESEIWKFKMKNKLK